MRSFFAIVSVLMLSLSLTACAGPGPRERMAERLLEFERHAGAPVRDFHFWDIDHWEALGADTIVVWTRVNEAWLIRVKRPCNGLEYASVVGLSSTNNRVSRSFDAVLFEHQRCRIDEIRPVDGRALKVERRTRAASERDR